MIARTSPLRPPFLGLILLLVFSCEGGPQIPEETDRSSLFSSSLQLGPNASLPRLTSIDKNRLILSYVKMGDNVDSLFFRTYNSTTWSEETLVTAGSKWFVNWADFPSVVPFDETGNQLSAHWLQYAGDGTYDYDIRMKTSSDAGKTWSESFLLNQDGIPAEHGFVSFASNKIGELTAVWLDGRFTKTDNTSTDGHDDHGHGGGGAMTLRTASVSPLSVITNDVELDHRICDCCQTDLVSSSHGMISVYRDRSEAEVRDIYFVHNFNGNWSSPQPVYNDNWTIKGCPVNGPSIASNGEQIATAWYTQARDTAKVQLAFWNQEDRRFDSPIHVDDGSPLGRVSVAIDQAGLAHLVWLEQTGTSAEIRYKTVNQKGEVSPPTTLAKNDGSRSTGFPQLESLKGELMVCYTEIENEVTSISCVNL